MTDLVNHPAHYNHYSIEAIIICEKVGYNLGNAVKYIYRRDQKAQREMDLKKAYFYLDREASRWRKKGAPNRLSRPIIEASRDLDVLSNEETDENYKSVWFNLANALYYADPKYLDKAAELLK